MCSKQQIGYPSEFTPDSESAKLVIASRIHFKNAQHTIFWVKILSAVPKVYKDLLRSEYNLFFLFFFGVFPLNSGLRIKCQKFGPIKSTYGKAVPMV